MNYFLICSDLASALVGPFNSIEEAKKHQEFLEQRNDIDLGIIITEEEIPNHFFDYTITPQEDLLDTGE